MTGASAPGGGERLPKAARRFCLALLLAGLAGCVPPPPPDIPASEWNQVADLARCPEAVGVVGEPLRQLLGRLRACLERHVTLPAAESFAAVPLMTTDEAVMRSEVHRFMPAAERALRRVIREECAPRQPGP